MVSRMGRIFLRMIKKEVDKIEIYLTIDKLRSIIESLVPISI